jgi:50S ribosomal protein L16 3-hydroxylase
MVSFATDGGGVGPHDDRYDVFLLQGPGKRRWQVSTQRDRAVDPAAAIRVLADFRAEEEWLLEPGDMLYLPPGVAHFGVAEGDCFTYSIGFLAPTHRTLVEEFLGYLGATLGAGVPEDRLYEDPGLRPAKDPLPIGDDMVDQVAGVLRTICWDGAHVDEFLGRFLTRPRPHARFHAPARPMTEDAFARRLRSARTLRLALPTRGLVRGRQVFLNGEAHRVSRATLATFATLLRERALPLPLRGVDAATLALLHAAYAAGYLRVA